MAGSDQNQSSEKASTSSSKAASLISPDGHGEEVRDCPTHLLSAEFASQFLSSPAITVLVGSGSNVKTFYCHRDLLIAHSPYFKAILSEKSLEDGITTIHELQEEDPAAFSIIAQWLYQGTIVSPASNTSGDRKNSVRAWCLAEKLGMQHCQNLIMDYFHELLKGGVYETNVAIGVKVMTLIHDLDLAEDNILRVFFIQRFAYEMVEMKRKHCRSNGTLKTGYVHFFKFCPLLIPDIMIEWYSLSLRTDHTDPADHTDPCAYHVHVEVPCFPQPRLYEQPTADTNEKHTLKKTLLGILNAQKPPHIKVEVTNIQEVKSKPEPKPLAESNDFWEWESQRFGRTDSDSSTPTP